jgi:hypothetical protein
VSLRSNANTLVTGAPISAMRRRLKYASLLYDRVLLESGLLRMHAGSGGSFAVVEHLPLGAQVRWQTPAQRHAEQAAPFQLGIGRETVPGVPAESMMPTIASDSEVGWNATLHPFAHELPAHTDWVDWVGTTDPQADLARIMGQWVTADERNPALLTAVRARFVRQLLIKNANRDLAVAAANGYAVAIDPLHMQVVGQRFRDEQGWRLSGYSVPVLYPEVGDLPWAAIAELRRERNIAGFRSVLREVEAETAAEASTGDVEAAAHHAYERHLAAASGRLEGVSTVARNTVAGIVIGGAIGVATMPLPAPLGVVVGTGAGTAISTISDVRKMIQQRRMQGWVAVHHKIESLAERS